MSTEELRQSLEGAFGKLEPPNVEELFEGADIDGFLKAVQTETGRAKRWQELRPFRKYQLTVYWL